MATFPNLTVLDVADLGRRVLDLLDRLAGILRLVALLALAAGLATLVGLALASAAARRQEGALLRVLGARRHHLVLALGAEYLVLGLLAGVLGRPWRRAPAPWWRGGSYVCPWPCPWGTWPCWPWAPAFWRRWWGWWPAVVPGEFPP